MINIHDPAEFGVDVVRHTELNSWVFNNFDQWYFVQDQKHSSRWSGAPTSGKIRVPGKDQGFHLVRGEAVTPTTSATLVPRYTVIPEKHYRLDDGSFSVLPPELLEYMTVIDCTPLGVQKYTHRYRTTPFETYLWSRNYTELTSAAFHVGKSVDGSHRQADGLPMPPSMGVTFSENQNLALAIEGCAGKTQIKVLDIKYLTSRNPTKITSKLVGSNRLGVGTKFIAYKTIVEVLDEDSLEFKEIELVRFLYTQELTNLLASNHTFKKLMDFLAIVSDPNLILKEFDKHGYLEYLAEANAKYTKYHQGLSYLLGEALGNVPFWDDTEVILKGQHITAPDLSNFFASSDLASSPEAKTLAKIKEASEKAKAHEAATKRDVLSNTALAKQQENEKQNYKRQIDYLERQMASTAEHIASLQKTMALQEESARNAEKKLVESRQVFEEFAKTVKGKYEKVSKDWYDNLLAEGIVLQDVVYRHPTYGAISYHDNQNVVSDPAWQLKQIRFSTIKPFEVVVDAESDTKTSVMAGPVSVILDDISRNGNNIDIKVKPASVNSIIGLNEISASQVGLIWVPHTEQVVVARDPVAINRAMQNEWRTGCRGEIIASFYYAFQARDPVQAVMAAMLWLKNANSEDQWGKQYPFFPTPDQVTNIEKPPEPEPAPEEATVVAEPVSDEIAALITEFKTAVLNH